MFDRQKLDRLLNQPMSRLDFFRNIGVLLITIFGLSSALNILSTGQTHSGLTKHVDLKHDFGEGRFGA